MKALMIALIVVMTGTSAVFADDLKAFPPAEDGFERYYLFLPEQADESVYKVELIVGKTLQVDPNNRYFLTGEIDTESIEGWGYSRYIVKALGSIAGTRMATNPEAATVERFIRLGSDTFMVPYNSRLPVVIYVPQDAEVRYRIWSAGVIRDLKTGH